MPKTTKTGLLQVNLTLTPDTYSLVCQHAPTRKAHGRFIGDAVKAYVEHQREKGLEARIDQLEAKVDTLTR
jgi:hypothetical protein